MPVCRRFACASRRVGCSATFCLCPEQSGCENRRRQTQAFKQSSVSSSTKQRAQFNFGESRLAQQQPRDTGGADNPLHYLPLKTGKIQFKLKTVASVLMLASLLWLFSTSLLHADVIRFRGEPWFRKSQPLSYRDLKRRTRSGLGTSAKSAYSAVAPPQLDILQTVKESSVVEKVEHLESVGQKLVQENAPLDYESLNEFQIYFFVLSLAHIVIMWTTFLVIRCQFRILHEYVTLMCFHCIKASLWRLAPRLESTDLSRLFVAANLNFDCLPPLEDPLDVAAVNEKILSHSGPRVLTKPEDGG